MVKNHFIYILFCLINFYFVIFDLYLHENTVINLFFDDTEPKFIKQSRIA